jgi:hypothetical protein
MQLDASTLSAPIPSSKNSTNGDFATGSRATIAAFIHACLTEAFRRSFATKSAAARVTGC